MQTNTGVIKKYAVRVAWPNGSHTVECLRDTLEEAERQQRRTWQWWCHGPARPIDCQVIVLTERQWNDHRSAQPCYDPCCLFSWDGEVG